MTIRIPRELLEAMYLDPDSDCEDEVIDILWNYATSDEEDDEED